MKSDKLAGLALIAGSVGMVAAMLFHPTGGPLEKIIREAYRNNSAHGLAIACIGLLAFGFARFTQVTATERPTIVAGLVAFALGAAAGVLAAVLNGFLLPGLAAEIITANPDEKSVWKVILAYNHTFNAVLSQVFIAAVSTAMLIWSLGMVRAGNRWTSLGVAGILIGLVSLLALFTGHIRNNVHDFGLYVLGLAIWTTALGVFLCRADGVRTEVAVA